jgi:hypothetical protein
MIFKHEDEVNGVPIGPLVEADVDDTGLPVRDTSTIGVPFDPNRKPDPWVTLADARRTARKLGLPLYEA